MPSKAKVSFLDLIALKWFQEVKCFTGFTCPNQPIFQRNGYVLLLDLKGYFKVIPLILFYGIVSPVYIFLITVLFSIYFVLFFPLCNQTLVN